MTGAGGDGSNVQSPFARLTTPTGLTYQPGLDGLRGISIVALVGFHLGVPGFDGAFFGMSLFFTLSGVLIGSLLLNEITSTGRFSLGQFWARRARRLLPAALVTLAVIAVARHLTDRLANTSGTEIAAATLNVSNWAFVLDRQSYADLFGAPSAVLHFWSLSVEEQFYLAIGVVFALMAWRPPRRPVLAVGVGAAITALISFALPFVTGWSVDRVYYGTDTRAGELMLGVAMAAWFASTRRRHSLIGLQRWLAPVAVVAAAGMVALWITMSPGTNGIRRGLLPLAACASALLVLGALVPAGPVAALTRSQPLRWLGRLSYCWYLVHWPVIVIADQSTANRSALRTVALVVVTLGLAVLLSVLVERPLRTSRYWRGRQGSWRLATASLVVLGIIGAGIGPDGRRSASADLLSRLDDGVPVGPVAPGASDTSSLPIVALFGDSVAFSLVMSMGQATVEPHYRAAISEVDIGCGIALSPSPPADDPQRCDDPVARYAEAARQGGVDVAVMFSCQWEVLSQRLPNDTVDRTIGDPVVDAHIATMFEAVTEGLRDAGVDRVLWTRCPYLSPAVGVNGLSAPFLSSRLPERTDRLNEIIDEFAGKRDDVDVLPFDHWVNQRVDDESIRPDGSHFEWAAHNPATDELIRLINAALANRQQ